MKLPHTHSRLVFSAPHARCLTLAMALAGGAFCSACGDDSVAPPSDGSGAGAGGASAGSAGAEAPGGTSAVAGASAGEGGMPAVAGTDAGGDSGVAGNAQGGGSSGEAAGGQAGAAGAPETGGAGTGADDDAPPSEGSVCPADPGAAPSGTLQASLVEAAAPEGYDYRLYEGPVWIDGALYFSDILPNPWDSDIRKFVPGSAEAPPIITGAGSNGLAVDANGVMFSATARLGEISRYDLSSLTQSPAVPGMFNSPNDLAIASDGTLYFSDPQQGELPQGGHPQVVHVVKDGVDTPFDESIQAPNGVTLSLAEDVLYISGGGYTGYVKKVALDGGMPGAIEDLVTGLELPDGMTLDCAGNLYVALHERGIVQVYSPDGDELATIELGNAANGQAAKPTNVAFGGTERKTLFITASYSLWQLDLPISGLPY